jgi:hypothetical protein
MTILTMRESWRKPRSAGETRRSADLSPEEHANVRKALRFLVARLGGRAKVAASLKVSVQALDGACYSARKRPSAALAIRTARVAGVSVEDVLAGRFPIAGACPHCGLVASREASDDRKRR